jgi:DNA-binding PadR family transcriptional regulator
MTPTALSHAILLALADEDRHGYAILKEVERQSGLRAGTGTLYAALQRLAADGLIAEAPESAEPDDDARRRYYRLTPEGREAARQETRRLARLVQVAGEKNLVPGLRLFGLADE